MKAKTMFSRYPSKISLLKDLRKGYPYLQQVFSLQVHENR
jgi:hypothetical protein